MKRRSAIRRVNTRNRVGAVIAAGGIGTRMSVDVPKQFIALAGRPILLRTLDRIAELDEVVQVVVALPAEHIAAARQLIATAQWKFPVECIPGGASRQESVRLGVERIHDQTGLILVHDAVRPLCDAATMRRVLEAARETGAAVPGIPVTDTIQRVAITGSILPTPPREEFRSIQTPQGFRSEVLWHALELARRHGFVGTDESSVVRHARHRVVVVEGSPDNIKITRPLDLKVAEFILSGDGSRRMMRIGQGTDYHRLVSGRKLILGGVEVPHELGLDGHSDADALSHAICDALLGGAALGDIGRHFPDTDAANRNRSSLEFLREIRVKLESAGWRACNVDATILAQKPRLSPYMETMRENIAGCLALDVAQVNVKATTTEGLNAEGRCEGISAQAVVLLESCRR